ncbi:geranylgeranyl-diphosphate geranylgeranyltransferase [Halobacteriales archaeon SW_7_68_16]|nr:MAG: geranylgeranyl-diphosphate geranylgeranyltransferase [Halobacteriales archaeon SW_7_68_16]
MVDDEQISQSKAIQRRTGKTFHLATRLLPERQRRATYVLYAFFRIADEVVDTEDPAPPDEQAAELERLRAEAKGEAEPRNPVMAAFVDMADEYGIPDAEIDEFVDAMKQDIETSRYPTYDDLDAYMRGSASAVGVMMTHVMDPDDYERATPHAVALGKAFQLTNFLRDVREDIVDRDRIYLPGETLDRHGVPESQIEDLRFTDDFAAAMADELARAESLYREGVAGIKYLPEDSQFAVLLAAVLYADHHRAIRRQGHDVLSTEPSLSTPRKLRLLAETWWRWRWSRDPEAVFRRVSAVPDDEADTHRTGSGGGWLPTR